MISKNRPFVGVGELWAALRAGTGTVERWEEAFAARVGAPRALAFPYNRVGLYAALEAHGIRDREVLLPGYSCVVVAVAVIASGNRPVFVDIDPRTYDFDLADLKRKVSPRTAAVVPTYMYGIPSQTRAVREACGPALVVEDLALATPGFAYVPPVLAHADVGIFSMDLNKITTAVNGAMVISKDLETHERMLAWRRKNLTPPGEKKRLEVVAALTMFSTVFEPRVYGVVNELRRRSAFVADRVRAYSLDTIEMTGDWRLEVSDAQAAVGLRQLDSLDEIIRARKANDALYAELLEGVPGLTLPERVEFPYSHYTIRVEGRDPRGFRERLYELGVECGRTLDYCLPDMELFASCHQAGSCPETTRAAAEVVNLPNYPSLTPTQVRFVARQVRAVLGEGQATERSGGLPKFSRARP